MGEAGAVDSAGGAPGTRTACDAPSPADLGRIMRAHIENALSRPRTYRDSKSSLLWWYPRVKDLDIPQPFTKIARIEPRDGFASIDVPAARRRVMEAAAAGMAGMDTPLFMRTDLVSGKHSWDSTCCLRRPEDLEKHVRALMYVSALADHPPRAIVFREMLDLDWEFRAFEGFPVATEARAFAGDGGVRCIHSYWHAAHIPPGIGPAARMRERLEPTGRDTSGWPGGGLTDEAGHAVPDSWKDAIRQQHAKVRKARAEIGRLAVMVQRAVGGEWSVDFALGRDGWWYLTDMAEAAGSWHAPRCAKRSPA